ncbi:hypothetical protein [Mesorhizobium sp. B1-1-8]|uniref:hypothetical protein n=1 Tax=Mesorhizobium sp. B1-1-8 TaxID=2589976 RepID=UPI0011297970|nr:hypothetical protein [Mesorhizobium sp. B1-1-8]UCI05674.1 hypothetical protein FJ974_17720 [Mesorhizobium sp. B1-1-8]
MYRGLRLWIGKTNRDHLDLIDLARRQADHLGPAGICAKRNQTNERFLKRGYIRLAPLTRRQRRKLMVRIANLGEPAIKVQRIINPNPRPR